MPKAPRVRAAFMTLHDYDDNDLDILRDYGRRKCRYMVYGKEICPTTSRPHIHVVAQFNDKVATTTLNKLCAPKNIDVKVHRPGQPLKCPDPTSSHFSADYCKKGSQSHEEWDDHGRDGPHFGDDADFWEVGHFVADGERTDLDREKIQSHSNLRSVYNDPDLEEVCKKHPRWVESVHAAKKPKRLENFIPRPWQAALIDRLDQEPDDRTIIWVYDPQGGAGKTSLTNYLVRNKGATILSGKAENMFYAYDMEPIILVDLPRSAYDGERFFCPYGAIEKLKDGIFFSGKYNSCVKTRDDPAHVVVFSNSLPEPNKWSDDRLFLIRLSEPKEDWTDQFGGSI